MEADKKTRLRIQTFGFTDIQYNGESIFFEKQITARLKSLLQYFIINKDKLCTPETIISELWPNNEYVDEKKVLQTYVHRLRNALSKENAFSRDFSEQIKLISFKGSYQMKISDEVKIDVIDFIALVDKVDDLLEYQDLIDMVLKLKDIYVGHFMHDSADDYIALMLQNHYQRSYCLAIGKILSKLINMEKYTDIIKICESFFVMDDLDETINRMYLKALIETGQTNSASRYYNFITKKMQEAFDVEPSQEMQSLYKNMKLFSGEVESNEGKSVEMKNIDSDMELISKNQIKNIINEMLAERLESKKAIYSIMKVEIISGTGLMDSAKILETVMLGSLRRKDIYAVLDDNTAIALLFEATEVSYEIIEKRVLTHYYKVCPNSNTKIKITISPAFRII